MKTIEAKEFYSWMTAITAFIFVQSISFIESNGVLDYVYVAATFVIFLVAIFKYIQTSKQSPDAKQS